VKRLLGHGHGGHGGQDSAVRSAEAIADELRNASQLLFFGFDFLPYSAIFCYILLYSAIFCYILLIRCLSTFIMLMMFIFVWFFDPFLSFSWF
jgi:hypothetical protein